MNCKGQPQDITAEKAALRKELRGRRRALSAEEVECASKAVAEKFFDLPAVENSKLILSYMPAKNELDVRIINEKLTKMGKRVAYPLCIEDGGLRLLVPESTDAFNIGAYGILEPDAERSSEVSAEELDLIIVPAVAFTPICRRLGQGGGYYDRLLARSNAVTVGVGYDFQLLDELPLEPHDRPLDFAVIPLGVFCAPNADKK